MQIVLVVLGGALAIAGGVGATMLTSRLERAESRRAARRDAYEEIYNTSTLIVEWSMKILPFITFEGQDVQPPLPGGRVRAQVLADLYGSPDVRDKLEDFTNRLVEFTIAADDVVGGDTDEKRAGRKALPQHRAALRDANKALVEAMRIDTAMAT